MKIKKHWTAALAAAILIGTFALAAPPPALAVEPDVGLAAISEVQVAALAHPDILAQEALVNSIAGLAVFAQKDVAITATMNPAVVISQAIAAKEDCVAPATTATSASPPLYAIPVATTFTADLVGHTRAGNISPPGDVEMNC